MKLEIYQEQKEKEAPKEPIRLKLTIRGDGVTIIVVNKNGTGVPQGNLLSFYKDGSISLHPSVNPDFGFNLDNHGKIRIRSN